MDKILKLKRGLIISTLSLVIILLFSSTLQAQKLRFSYESSQIKMDSTWDKNNDMVIQGIIDFYKPELDRVMNEVIAVSEVEMRSGRPESLLSNFAVDLLYEYSKEASGGRVDFALTNFGGLRAALPKGDVRRYDIFSIFPFENYVVIIDIWGKDLIDLFNSMASRSVEALSYNVLVEISNGKLKDVLLEGEQIDITRKYRVATIDFLLGAGDSLSALTRATEVENTGVLLRDAIITMIEERSALGQKLTSSITNRVRYE